MSDSLYREATVRAPTPSHLRRIAERTGLDIDDDDLAAYHQSAKAACDAINDVEMLPEPILPTKYPRTPGYRPSADENKLNAWYWKTDIVGASRGKLLGKTVAIKDNIAVAGVPMMVGCSALEGYVPEFDATVVTRILDEGGHVKGKTICEGLCAAGASYTCNKGPVKNFHNPNHNAGGSSCGSATLVASGEVDLALGSDQGGSIRIPASWCGLAGIKPTFGLVPYTGSMAFEPSVDHLGPLARTVHDCALFLEVLAGYDNGLDPRQRSDIKVPQYSTEMKVDNLDGLKIGLVKEGFEMPDADDQVHKMVKKSLHNLEKVGAEVKEVSLPLHKKGGTIWRMVYTEGFSDSTFRYGGAGGRGLCGFYPTSLSSFALKSFRSRINDISHSSKLYYLLGEYFSEAYPGIIYNKGQNLRRLLTSQYDEALNNFDVLAMPTIPFTAPKLPDKTLSTKEYLETLGSISVNTRPHNLTGHPAISLNAGFHGNGLPVGTMLISKHFDEVTLFKVSYHFESINMPH